ncbi:hypothetical protein [Kaistella faecalis]|uniref:hypothetical protein n=1 Tax=Kaistella faecalis TaxID=2852098 RepID=UPI001E621416|nr:hypothetical protein [Chryseobacterium faecale]UFK98203.1 hypothetical protein LL667_02315 [Chryseobacterium faecale]
MKKFLLIFLLASGFAFSQMPNIAEVWMNKSQPYTGTIAGKEPLKIKINISEQNRKNDQEYFLAGYSMVEKNFSKFEGKLKINQYRDGKKRSTVYGEYGLRKNRKANIPVFLPVNSFTLLCGMQNFSRSKNSSSNSSETGRAMMEH